jgi:hypothetical protein
MRATLPPGPAVPRVQAGVDGSLVNDPHEASCQVMNKMNI